MTFSIVTPSFRQLDWLRLCAASVADQTGPTLSVEHIVQDAGSGPALESWAQGQGGQLRLFMEADAGMYDAINRGLRRATGEICAYLNCDEQYLPGTLNLVADFFAEHPTVDVLFGDAVLIDNKGCLLSYRRTVLPEREHMRASHLNTLSCATFFRRRLLKRGFYFDPQWRAIGDHVWMDSLLRARVSMATLPQPLAVFTFTGENLGASAVSIMEGAKWNGSSSSWLKPRWMAAVLRHRLRKALAGAYQLRNVELSIHTPASPTRRVMQTARKLGYGWPVGRGRDVESPDLG